MIEYLLVFALGFCAAMLLVLIIAPAVRGRIVTLTERRVRATAALSAGELRAEKDAARAVYAMENRRLSTEIRGQRERLGTLLREREGLTATLATLRGANVDFERRIEEITTEAGELRSAARAAEESLAAAKAEVVTLQRAGVEGRQHFTDLSDRIERLTGDIENYKIDLATGETQIETLKSQIGVLRDERKKLREEVKEATSAVHDLRNRLEREERRSAALDARLSESISGLSDRDGALERRAAEIERLQDKLNAARQGLEGATRALKEAEASRKELESKLVRLTAATSAAEEEGAMPNASENASDKRQGDAIAARIERLRARHGVLVENLTRSDSDKNDAVLRDEIAEIAAMMVDLTAAREGPNSPIHAILASGEDGEAGAPSLADRARGMIRARAEVDPAETP